MNDRIMTLPAPPETGASDRHDEPCTLIITVESGVVTDIIPTGSVEAVIVDLDMIENDDNLEQRLLKAVMPLESAAAIRSIDLNRLVACLVSEYRRPAGKRPSPVPKGTKAA